MATERELNRPDRRGVERCPRCATAVDRVITGRRHSMGTWIPVWGPGPCKNPECPSRAVEASEDD